MSHFTCLVITEPNQNPENLLAPYSEALRVPEYQDWNLEIATKERSERIAHYTSILSLPKEKQERYNTDYCYREKIKLESMSDEDYLRDSLYDTEERERGYRLTTYNPHSKWDWYKLGGRWINYLHLRPGCRGVKGEPSWNSPGSKRGYCDQALNTDIFLDEVEQPYAFITLNGKWHSIGRMGWWGISTDEDERAYQKQWDKLLRGLKTSAVYRLSAYDLHI